MRVAGLVLLVVAVVGPPAVALRWRDAFGAGLLLLWLALLVLLVYGLGTYGECASSCRGEGAYGIATLVVEITVVAASIARSGARWRARPRGGSRSRYQPNG